MTDVVLNPGAGGATLHTDTVAGVDTQIIKIGFAPAGISPVLVSSANPFPVVINNFPTIQSVAVTNFPSLQAVTVSNVVAVQGSFTIASSPIPINVNQDSQILDDDGIPYVNPNVPGADIATGDRQAQSNALLASILAVEQAPPTTPIVGSVSVTNLPTTQPVSISGSVSVASRDEPLLDDDGIPFVNPNVPGADIATGDKQSQILAALQSTQPRNVTGAVAVIGTASVAPTSTPLPPNAALELGGQLQKISDLLEAIFAALRVNNILISQLSQPTTDSLDQLQNDFTLTVN